MTTHRPVRLTREAAELARWIYADHRVITPELIKPCATKYGFNQRDVAVLLDALNRAGLEGVKALARVPD